MPIYAFLYEFKNIFLIEPICNSILLPGRSNKIVKIIFLHPEHCIREQVNAAYMVKMRMCDN